MKYSLLDTVVLKKDIPGHSLRKGDVGVVVEIYDAEGVEVEFVAPNGDTRAVVTLDSNAVRAVTANDRLAVRTTQAS